MRELLFGTAYYPEYMPYDRLEKDIRMMKTAGMNTLRIAESTWSTLEPEDGTWDFSYIDRVLKVAGQEKMSVIIGTPTYAVPSWLAKKDPEIMVEGKEGRAFYGARQLVDIMHPLFRFHAERVIRKLLEHTARHPSVIGFQIDNETKHYGNFGRYMQESFVSSLKEKYGTTHALNQAFHLDFWSNAIHSWDDFPDLRGCCNGGLAGAFSAFQRSMAADYLKWLAGIVLEYKTEDQFITHNFDFEWKKFGAEIAQDGYSYGVQPDMDHYEASAAVTIAGADIYHPTQDELTGAEIAFGGDEIRCLKQNPYLVLEMQAQGFKNWTPYPGQLRLQAYSHLASGAAGALYWNWHSIHNGYETYWKGILSHDLEPNAVYREICRIGQEWKEIGARHLRIRKENRVALVVDNLSLTALQWFPIDKDLSYNDVVRWMYDSLYECNVECDVVDVQALEPTRYQTILTPALYCVSEEMLKKLDHFVRDGGILISSFKSFAADEQSSVYHDRQPHMLHSCFGIHHHQFTAPGTAKAAGKPVRYFMELLETDTAETIWQYDHKYWGKYAAATRNAYGNGYAFYIGCYTDKDNLKEIYKMALEGLKDTGLLVNAGSAGKIRAAWPVIIRSGRNEAGKRLHYIMNYSDEEKRVVCPFEKAVNLLDRKQYQKEETIAIKEWDLILLEEA